MEIKKFKSQSSTIKIVKNDNSQISNAIKSGLPIRQIDQKTQKVILLSEVTALSMRFNSESSPEMIALMTSDLYLALQSEYAHLSIDEVKLAFQKGIVGKYGKSYGMNLKTCLEWLFLYNKERQKHLSELILQQDVIRIKKDDEIWKEKQGKKIIKDALFGYTDIEVKDRNELYNDTLLKYKRFTYKKRYVDILKYKDKILARKMNDGMWRQVNDEEKVLKYLVENSRRK